MKIIAHGKESVNDAVKTAEVALVLGVKKVVVECVPAATTSFVSPGVLAFCPVTDCSECSAIPCPFGHKAADKKASLQEQYESLEAQLHEVGNKLREEIING
ncbi:TPA: hypothetical protein QCH65_000459 [Enterobacter roggenkampii]|nr:hypothetical protein [Enterobacter roggenkampii]